MHAFLKTGKLGPGSTSVGGPSKEKTTSQKRNTSVPWVEKYRPRTVDDVAYQDEVVSVLKKILQGADLPNLLFYGPPGTGKTSTILAAARQLFGDIYKERVMELNASDERGIAVIREKVKRFAQTTVASTRTNGQPCPPYKIIILDEADSMTSAAQAALRRTMEKQSGNTRFCLLCNYVSRIIEPLTSRCSKFRFKPLSKPILLNRLEHISTEEGVQFESNGLMCLIDTCEGDLRRAITSLQSMARLKAGQVITAADVHEVTGVVPNSWIEGLFETCTSNSYDKVCAFVEELILEGYSAAQLLDQIHDYVILHDRLSDNQKTEVLLKLAVCDHRLTDGGDEFLQILDLSCTIMAQLQKV